MYLLHDKNDKNDKRDSHLRVRVKSNERPKVLKGYPNSSVEHKLTSTLLGRKRQTTLHKTKD